MSYLFYHILLLTHIALETRAKLLRTTRKTSAWQLPRQIYSHDESSEFDPHDSLVKDSVDTFFVGLGHSASIQDRDVAIGTYKHVDRKIKPVPGVFPEDARVTRQFPKDPLASLPVLSTATQICPDGEINVGTDQRNPHQ